MDIRPNFLERWAFEFAEFRLSVLISSFVFVESEFPNTNEQISTSFNGDLERSSKFGVREILGCFEMEGPFLGSFQHLSGLN